MKKLLLGVLITFLIGFSGFAQTLSIDSLLTEINVPDTSYLGANLNYNTVVRYNGVNPFSGTIYIVAGVDSSAGLQSVDTIGMKVVGGLTNGDTTNIIVNDTVDVNYRVGGNVVVIWPVAAGASSVVGDFRTNIWIEEFNTGLRVDRTLYGAIKIYPNPSKNYINIDNTKLKKTIKQVRIINVNGQLLYSEKFKSKIDISHLPKGIYFLNLELKEGEVLYYKLIKE